jgi:hypothetical protein
MAADRTLMAWMRTALSMISFGFTIYKFLETVGQHTPLAHPHSARQVGLFLVGLGTVSMILGTISYWTTLRDLKKAGPFRLGRPALDRHHRVARWRDLVRHHHPPHRVRPHHTNHAAAGAWTCITGREQSLAPRQLPDLRDAPRGCGAAVLPAGQLDRASIGRTFMDGASVCQIGSGRLKVRLLARPLASTAT